MAYIAPNTTIKFYSGVPFDNTYKDVRYFTSVSSQNTYFHSTLSPKYTVGANSYQRVAKNKMRVALLSDNLYDCNYIAFQNTNFGNKWFYAFVLNVEYVNNVTSEITYQIDDFQTYFLDCTFKSSMVIREHVSEDTFENCLVPENLPVGDYTNNDIAGQTSDEAFWDLGDDVLGVYCLYNIEYDYDKPVPDLEYSYGTISNNVYSGYTLFEYYSGSSYQSFHDQCAKASGMIGRLAAEGKIDGVANLFMFKSQCLDSVNPVLHSITLNTSLNGYTPKNRKVLTYPYNMLVVDNNLGTTATYKFEYFDYIDSTNTAYFTTDGTVATSPMCFIMPRNYKGIYDNYGEMLTYNNFPICAFSYNAYQNWVANNQNSLALTGVAGALQTGGGLIMATSSPELASSGASMMMSGANTLASQYANILDQQVSPMQAKGNALNNCLNYGIERVGFSVYNKCITADYAESIDDYFTKYGYKVLKLKVPNLTGRTYWNYVQTQDASIVGECPTDSLTNIKNMFNRGVTLWHTNDVGNYALDNSL